MTYDIIFPIPKEFKCKYCDKVARWLVWYEGFGGLYNYLCTRHAVKAMRSPKYRAVCVRSIKDAIKNKSYDYYATQR